ncbi:MAG: LCP family protein [Spirochaetaceae bacterium]|nr:LCP family protein [Spirochaetaceae bacterium]
MIFLRKYFIVFIITIAVLLNFSLLFILLSRTGRLENRMTKSSNVESSFNETVKATLVKTKDEINILRDMVNLPSTSFPSFEEKEENRDANSDSIRGYEIYYIAFEKLYSQHKKNAEMEKLNKFSVEINPLLTKYKFQKEQKDSVLYLLSENNIYFSFEYNAEKDNIIANYFPFENKSDIVSVTDFQIFIDDTYLKVKSLYEKSTSDIQKLKNYINSENIKKSFLEKRIKTIPITENKDLYNIKLFSINRINNQFIGTVAYSYKKEGFLLNDKFFGDYDKIKDIILNIDLHIDIRTNEEKIIEQSIKDIKKIAEDPSFKMFLENRGYYLSLEPREDTENIYFDFIPKGNGKHIGSFAINLYTGEIYLTDFEEIQISSIKTLKIFSSDNQEQKKKIDNPALIAKDKNKYLNFLICGNHEKNSDTIIVASLDLTNQILNLISVPRDIYYKGRKLNAYYRLYGPERFKEIIEIITGFKISRYFFIDMFAFIDVINILGGIDITLDQDLIDPTYKVRNNGVWSTLYYKKGTYHLDGIETLRIARARHFTPVFSRDDRQQKIIISLHNKISELSITDFDIIYNIIKTLITYLDTDISITESLGLLNDVKNINKFNKIILSTENILTQTYTNLMYLGLKEDDVDDDFDKGAWILVPVNNNWNSINYFLQKAMQVNSSKNEILD